MNAVTLAGARLLTPEFKIEPQKFVFRNREIELGAGLEGVLNRRDSISYNNYPFAFKKIWKMT